MRSVAVQTTYDATDEARDTTSARLMIAYWMSTTSALASSLGFTFIARVFWDVIASVLSSPVSAGVGAMHTIRDLLMKVSPL